MKTEETSIRKESAYSHLLTLEATSVLVSLIVRNRHVLTADQTPCVPALKRRAANLGLYMNVCVVKFQVTG